MSPTAGLLLPLARFSRPVEGQPGRQPLSQGAAGWWVSRVPQVAKGLQQLPPREKEAQETGPGPHSRSGPGSAQNVDMGWSVVPESLGVRPPRDPRPPLRVWTNSTPQPFRPGRGPVGTLSLRPGPRISLRVCALDVRP